MAGHSKWKQIKHKKALTDAKRGKAFSKITKMITVATREKGPNPEMNSRLRSAIEKAREIGVPSDNIARAIKHGAGTSAEDQLEEVLYEAFGPGGAPILIQGITNSRNRTTAEIEHILSEHSGRLAEKGSVEWMFKRTTAFDIDSASQKIDAEELELMLIDAGAEDIARHETTLTVYSSPSSAESLKKTLENSGIKISEEYFDFIPNNEITVESPETREALAELLSALDDHEGVQEIYTNVSL